MNEYVTEVYAIAVWGGIAFLYLASLMDKSRALLKGALIATLIMTSHHIYGENMKPTIGRGLPTRCTHNGPKRAKWKFHCPISLKQEDDACLATAITHAIYSGSECFLNAELIAHDLDLIINTHDGGHRADVWTACKVACRLGYASTLYRVHTFEEYKEAIKDHPVVIGFDQFEGMATPSYNGLLGPTGGKTGTKHAMTLLGRHPRWWGRYSVLKNSGGPDWGERFGECKITDGDLKKLWEIGNVQAVAIVR